MQVNDLDSSDSSMTRATSPGYLRYPPPAVFVANAQSGDRVSLAAELPLMSSLPFLIVPSVSIDDSRIELQHASRHVSSSNMQGEPSASLHLQSDANVAEPQDGIVSSMETFPVIPPGREGSVNNSFPNGIGNDVSDYAVDAMDTDEMQPVGVSRQGDSMNLDTLGGVMRGIPSHISSQASVTEFGQLQHLLPIRDRTFWELPFLQGWIMGQSQAGVPPMLPPSGGNRDHSAQHIGSSLMSHQSPYSADAPVASLAVPSSISLSGPLGRSGQHHIPHSRFSVSESRDGATSSNILHDGTDTQPIVSRIQSELATSLAAAAAAELPCTVKLRVWSHDIKNPGAALTAERCRLTIPHAVLCR